MSADNTYSSRDNINLVDSLDGTAYILCRSNAVVSLETRLRCGVRCSITLSIKRRVYGRILFEEKYRDD